MAFSDQANQNNIPAGFDDASDEVYVFPASYGQRRLWFLDQFEPDSPFYNIPSAVRLRGALDVSAMRRTLNEIVRRHESLRTTFATVEGEPVQVIHPTLNMAMPVQDLTHLPKDEREAEARRAAMQEARRPFDLAQGPLLRAALLRLAEDDHVVLLTMHHIISDGWSMAVLVGEIAAIYGALVTGKPSPLPDLPIQYADYAQWQRDWLQGAVLASQMDYWKKQLAGAPAVLELPTDRPRPAVYTSNGASTALRLSRRLADALNTLSRQAGATLFMTLLAAFQTLLHRYSGQDDICVGSPIANRTRAETEGLIGLFINTLVFRTDLSGNPTFRSVMQRVRDVALGAFAHQDLPFEMLVEALQPERDMSHQPLFQVMLIVQNAPANTQELPGLTISTLDVETGTATADLTLSVSEAPDGLHIAAEYNTDLFDGSTIDRLLLNFERILAAVVADPDQPIAHLTILHDAERQRLLDWNRTKAVYPDLCVHQLFERQAAATPSRTAVVFGNEELSYNELNRRANQLARRLRDLGVGPDTPVGICIERSTGMIVAALAVLKAGGAYVPLDPTYPQERLAFMLDDTRAPVILTQESLAARLPQHQALVVCLDADWPGIGGASTDDLPCQITPANLAYIIYTSGSTGKAKGVMVRHRSLANAYFAWEDAYRLRREVSSHLQMASFSFDVCSADIVRALLSGGKLVICPRQHLLAAKYLYQLMLRQGVDIAEFVPAVLRNLADYLEENGLRLDFLKALICGSDTWYVGEYRRFKKLCSPQTRVINSFGVTEATIDSSYFEGPITGLSNEQPVPIGRPFANTQLWVVDDHMQLAPIGVPGELCIGGAGLAAGYLNRPDLTAEKFVADPFSTVPGALLYRTGDRARWLASGAIEFLGRIDFQVKIRGFRIEPGEIEAVLGQHPALRQCVVVPHTVEGRAGDKALVAYVVPADGSAPDAGELRRFVQASLPDYMTPAAFVAVPSVPLLPNGKLDRQSLPAPDWSHSDHQRTFVAPRTPTEELVASIWEQVLAIPRVSAEDDFFALGGHSLLAAQLVSRLRRAFAVDLPLRYVFESPTVAALAQRVDQAQKERHGVQTPPLRPAPRNGDLPLSFSQQRLWFLDQLEPNNASYNMPDAVRLNGPLDVEALHRSLNEIVRRHEALRTTFANIDGRAVQIIAPSLTIPLPVVDLSALRESGREAEVMRLAALEARQPFDLAHGPLLRARLLRLGPQEHVALLTMHHIVSDDWSANVFVQEMGAIYTAFVRGLPSPLPEPVLQYVDYAYWQRQWLQGEVLQSQLDYWKEQLNGAPAMIDLPTDRPRPAVQTFPGAFISFALPPSLTSGINELCRKEGVTLFMALMAAFQTLLHRYSGQDDLCVGAPIANRNRREIEGLIGFFVNTLVLRSSFAGDPSFRELLQRVRTACLGAYAHQDVPFESVVEAVKPQRDLSHSPLFDVMFVLQNMPRQAQLIGDDLTLSGIEAHSGAAKFDLTLFMVDQGSQLGGALEYNTDLFDAATIARMIEHFQTLLEAVVAQPAQPVSTLPLLAARERQQVLIEWNQTDAPYPSDKCAHELFEAQVERTPEAIAVSFGEQRLTYRDLDMRANQLAAFLRRYGIGPDVLVGVCAGRSLELVVALLGVLKAGGAYVPLDPSYPAERLAFMLEDARVPVLLTQQRLAATLPASQATVVCLDSQWSLIAQESAGPVASGVGPEHLAYVIYTSGSTGRPKGAMIIHRGLVNYLTWCQRAYPLAQGKGAPIHSSISFDLTVTAIFGPLVAGGQIYLLPDDLAVETLVACLRTEGDFSLVKITPAHLQLLSQQLLPKEAARRTHAFIIGGENLLTETLSFWQNNAPGTMLVNEYGPTETVVGCCVYVARPEQRETGSVPIGRPIINTRLYILDQHMQPAPIGVRGELYIGGAGVARGYLNRPDLTAERFVPDPFCAAPGARLYKTGDVCRYRADGVIEFFGRLDHQVKIRGYRVELGEIEAVIGEHPAVKECVVVAREDAPGVRRLAAYVVANEAETLDVAALRERLKARLPEYMIPTAFIPLPALPLTPNGKVDRRALPAPDVERPSQVGGYAAPRTWAEQTLAGIWAAVLGIEHVGINDNFFELGGDSILSIQVVTRANQAGLRLTPKNIFQAPTVAGLAALAGTGAAITAEQGVVEGPLPLTPIQQWFFEQDLATPHHWNQSLMLETTERLDATTLRAALGHIVAHHDALRLRFTNTGHWQQTNAGLGDPVPFVHIDLADAQDHLSAAIEEHAHALQASLNIERGPLLVVALLDPGARRSQRLLIAVHHLAIDAVSWSILLDDLLSAYQQIRSGRAPQLPPKTTSFRTWAHKLAEYAQSSTTLDHELDFWLDQAGRNAIERLPRDRKGANTEASARLISVALTQDETDALLHEIPAAYHASINDILLTALSQAVARWTRSPSVLIDLEGHGRADLFDEVDLTRTIGWFTSLYPVRIDVVATEPAQALLETKQQLARIPNQGVGFGLLRYLSSHSGVLATRPQAEISFNYLGQMDQMASLSTAVALARESTGYDRGPDNLRCYLVDINSTVAGGRLAFEWTYSENVHRRATIARVADDFIVALRAIMASGGPGAVQRDAGPEIDADEFGWSEEDVRDIMDLMRKKR